MQLGTRWAFGEEPPAKLPEAVVTAIREVEATANTTLSTGPSPLSGVKRGEPFVRRWTLTWLEGLPHVELDPESGSNEVSIIRYNPDKGVAHITASDPDEEPES